MIEKFNFQNQPDGFVSVLHDPETATAFVAFRNQYESIPAETLSQVINRASGAKKLVLIPVDDTRSEEEYESIAYHYYTHPKDIESLKLRHPAISTVIVKWLPIFFSGYHRMRFVGRMCYYPDLGDYSTPDALAEHLKRKIAKNEKTSEENVFVSEWCLPAGALLGPFSEGETSAKDDVLLRATLKLINRVDFVKTVFSARDRPLFQPNYYIGVAIRLDLDPVLDVQQYVSSRQRSLTNVADAETKELYRLIAPNAEVYFSDALDWFDAWRVYVDDMRKCADDFESQLKSLTSAVRKTKRLNSRYTVWKRDEPQSSALSENSISDLDYPFYLQ